MAKSKEEAFAEHVQATASSGFRTPKKISTLHPGQQFRSNPSGHPAILEVVETLDDGRVLAKMTDGKTHRYSPWVEVYI